MAKVQRSFGARIARGLGKFVLGSTGIGFGVYLVDKYLNEESLIRNTRAFNAAAATAVINYFFLNKRLFFYFFNPH